MAVPVIMPRQGISVESCVITEWHKNVGEAVAPGDVLFSYETDKAAFEETAKEGGTLLARFFEAGDEVVCLLNVCVIGKPGESFAEFDPKGGSGEAAAEPEKAAESAESSAAQVASAPVFHENAAEDVRISPRAKHLAEKEGITIANIAGSGPYGRIVEADIKNIIKNGPVATRAASASLDAASGIAGTGLGGRVRVEDIEGKKAAPAVPAVCGGSGWVCGGSCCRL